MKKIISIFLALMMLSSCSSPKPTANIISQTVEISQNASSQPEETVKGEMPDSNATLPNEMVSSSMVESTKPQVKIPSSSQPPKQSSSPPSSQPSKQSSTVENSQPPKQSSSIPSSQPPKQSSSTPSSQPSKQSSTVESSQPPKQSSSEHEEQPDSPKEDIVSQTSKSSSSHQEVLGGTTSQKHDEVRAVWISYLDLYAIAQGKTKAQFISNIDSVYKEAFDYGLNTVYVQVRPFGDALYPSDLAPWSHTISATKTEGDDPGYDPLAIMIDQAKKYDFTFEAWLNPFRIRNTGTKVELSSDNPAKKLLNSGDRSVVEHAGSISYNPANSKARTMIVDVVMEIIQNYDVDGIHFDDYFYPTTDKNFDLPEYNTYLNNGGKMSQADWRRDNVSKLIKSVYSAIKEHDKNIIFGISPQAKMENNYHAQFVDVEKMINEPGYIDYVCPQIYFGFDNESMPYDKILKEWSDMVAGSGKSLYIGLGPYKSGVEDKWAGAGKNEWIDNTDITKRMVQSGRKQSEYDGFAIFRSEYFFRPTGAQSSYINKERSNLATILK